MDLRGFNCFTVKAAFSIYLQGIILFWRLWKCYIFIKKLWKRRDVNGGMLNEQEEAGKKI